MTDAHRTIDPKLLETPPTLGGSWTKDRVLPVGYCRGCEDDFYNDHNPYGVKQCWMRKGAKVEHRYLVPVDMPPPYKSLSPLPLPTCYKLKRHVNVKEDAIRSDGYWRCT